MARPCLHHAVPEPTICVLCAAYDGSRRRKRRALLIVGLLLLPIAGITIYLFTLPAPPPPPPKPEVKDQIETYQRDRLAKEPCEPKTSMNLVDRLMELRRYKDAQTFATESITKCGVIGRMKWRLAYASQQLRDAATTIKVTSELVAETPEDSDFWWWRGEAYADTKHVGNAVSDYRQSLALSFGAQAGQFAANRLYSPAKAGGAMCEAGRAWRFYHDQLGGQLAQEMRDELAAQVREKTCNAEHGTGTGAIGPHVRVTLEGATATFDVDRTLGTTLVSRMFAAKAGIVATGAEQAQTQRAGKLYTGEPMKLTLHAGSTTAKQIDVLVTDDLPGDAAGVIGLSYLWHFDFDESGEGARLSPPVDRPL